MRASSAVAPRAPARTAGYFCCTPAPPGRVITRLAADETHVCENVASSPAPPAVLAQATAESTARPSVSRLPGDRRLHLGHTSPGVLVGDVGIEVIMKHGVASEGAIVVAARNRGEPTHAVATS